MQSQRTWSYTGLSVIPCIISCLRGKIVKFFQDVTELGVDLNLKVAPKEQNINSNGL